MTSKPDSWLPLYVADYLADTTRLTTEQHGAYLLLIMDYWRNGPPPDDDTVLARITGLTLKRWKAHRPAILPFFSVVAKVWRQKRVDEEIERAKENQQKRIERAKQGAGARWAKDAVPDATSNATSNPKSTPASNATSTPEAMLVQCPLPSPSPLPSSLPPPSPEESAPAAHAKRNGSAKKAEKPALTSAVWNSFAYAYKARYGTDPVSNAKVNGMLARLVERIGESEAPSVAAFYVHSNRGLYVSAKHCVDLLLRDCEGLRTEWATGRTVTDTEARQVDRKQSNLSVAEKLIAEERAKHV